MADSHANFAASLVATAPSPATSGTSLVVTTGDGAKFPAVPFNATICPASTQPTTANAEIVRVTAVATDTLTITRTQESTSARTVVVGDQIFAGITAKTLTDVEVVAPATGGLRRAGGYCLLGVVSGNTATTANNTEQCIPFVISNSSVTADRISCEVTVAGNVGALIRLGIRADNGRGLPFSTVILDAGTIAADTTGTKEITISQALTPGLYWATLTAQSAGTTAPTVRLCNLNGSLPATGWTTSIAATNQAVSGYNQTGVSGALPSSFTLASTNGAAGTPQIWMRFV